MEAFRAEQESAAALDVMKVRRVGFGRIIGSEIEIPNMLANLVKWSERAWTRAVLPGCYHYALQSAITHIDSI